MQTIRYQVRFKEKTEIGDFSDCLYYDKLPSQKEIDKAIAVRIANWIDIVKNPPAPIKPTKEQLEAEQVALDEQIIQMQARKVELSTMISAKVK